MVLILFGLLLAPTVYADDGWEVLYNGQDLAGWRPILGDGSFTVEDGAIRANAKTMVLDHLLYSRMTATDRTIASNS